MAEFRIDVLTVFLIVRKGVALLVGDVLSEGGLLPFLLGYGLSRRKEALKLLVGVIDDEAGDVVILFVA